MARPKKLVTQFYELEVKDVMDKRTWDIPVIERQAPLENVLAILAGKNHLWVVEDKTSKRLVGVITEKDFLNVLAPPKISPYTFGFPNIKSLRHGTAEVAEDIMSKRLVTCSSCTAVGEVLELMTSYQVRRIPVVEDHNLVGEITLAALLRKFYEASRYMEIK